MTQAVILVGGQGTRLRPLTCNLPKPMVPVLNIPFLEHVIRNLRAHKIIDIIMAQHYLAEAVESYFGNGQQFGVRLTYVIEDNPRGTAGAIKNVEKHLHGTFLVLNGDIFANRNFTDMLDKHHQHHAKATISLTPVEDPTIYGVVETDSSQRVKKFLEKPKLEDVSTNLINAGTYVLEPEILAQIPPAVKVSIERETFPQLLADEEPVYGYLSHDYWMDTGTVEKYLQLHRDLLLGKCHGYKFEKDLEVGNNCKIHRSVKTTGKIIVGDNCVIGPRVKLSGPVVIGQNCQIGSDVRIDDSVIWKNVIIGSDCSLQTCAIANDCTIREKCQIAEVVIGDHITLPPNSEILKGTRLFPEGHFA